MWISIDGYQKIITCNRENKKSGGLYIAVEKGKQAKLMQKFRSKSCQLLAVKLTEKLKQEKYIYIFEKSMYTLGFGRS